MYEEKEKKKEMKKKIPKMVKVKVVGSEFNESVKWKTLENNFHRLAELAMWNHVKSKFVMWR